MTTASSKAIRSKAAEEVADLAPTEASAENATGLPNLAGVATKDLVEQIGTGKYSASYISWSRTLNLLRTHAPGWMVEAVPAADGRLEHRAPVGGYLLIRFRHVNGQVTPAVPQAIMDNRNAAIAFDKISSRDITDTHRRGACLAAAMFFGLAYELWAKLPLESGYAETELAEQPEPATSTAAPATPAPATPAQRPTKEQFLEAALEKGLTTYAAESLASKLNNNYAGGITRLKEKDAAWVAELNAASAPKEQSPTADGSKW
jgi:hypothetical protein